MQSCNGWEIIEKFINETPVTGGYSNFYAANKISNAYIADLKKISISYVRTRKSLPFIPYPKVNDLANHPLLERAILANYALMEDKATNLNTSQQEIFQALNLNEELVLAARPLVTANKKEPISKFQYEKLIKLFDFKFSNLQKLDVVTRAYSLNNLFYSFNEIATTEEWQEAISTNIRYLRSSLGNFETALADHQDLIPSYFETKTKLQMLGVNEQYWDYEAEALKTNNELIIKAVITSLPSKATPPENILSELVNVFEMNMDLRPKIFETIANINSSSDFFKATLLRLIETSRIGVAYGNYLLKKLIEFNLSSLERERLLKATQRIFQATDWGHNNGVSRSKSDVPNTKEFLKTLDTILSQSEKDHIFGTYFKSAISAQAQESDNDRAQILNEIAISFFDQLSRSKKVELTFMILDTSKIGIAWDRWALNKLINLSPTPAEREKALIASQRIFRETDWGHNNGVSRSQSDVPNNKEFFLACLNLLDSLEIKQSVIDNYLQNAEQIQKLQPDNDRASMINFVNSKNNEFPSCRMVF